MDLKVILQLNLMQEADAADATGEAGSMGLQFMAMQLLASVETLITSLAGEQRVHVKGSIALQVALPLKSTIANIASMIARVFRL